MSSGTFCGTSRALPPTQGQDPSSGTLRALAQHEQAQPEGAVPREPSGRFQEAAYSQGTVSVGEEGGMKDDIMARRPLWGAM